MREKFTKFLFGLMMAAFLCPLVFCRKASADAGLMVAVNIYLMDSSSQPIKDESVYRSLKAKMYEDGIYKATITPWFVYVHESSSSARFIAGEDEDALFSSRNTIRLSRGHQYDFELVVPDGYVVDLVSDGEVQAASGNIIHFTYDGDFYEEANLYGADLSATYFYRKTTDPVFEPTQTATIDLGSSPVTVTYGDGSQTLWANISFDGENKNTGIPGDYLKKIVCESDDPSVVSVTNDEKELTVSFLKPGIATITVSTPGWTSADFCCKAAKATLTYQVLPKQITSLKATANSKKKTVKITWKKDTTVTGYCLEVASNKKFTKNKKVYVFKSNKTVSKTIKKLKKGTYYIRIRSYITTDQGTLYGAYSKTRSVKIKK